MHIQPMLFQAWNQFVNTFEKIHTLNTMDVKYWNNPQKMDNVKHIIERLTHDDVGTCLHMFFLTLSPCILT